MDFFPDTPGIITITHKGKDFPIDYSLRKICSVGAIIKKYSSQNRKNWCRLPVFDPDEAKELPEFLLNYHLGGFRFKISAILFCMKHKINIIGIVKTNSKGKEFIFSEQKIEKHLF
jgi:hypothetical protein